MRLRIRRTGGSPASIHIPGALTHWMELGAMGERGPPSVQLGEPPETVTGSVDRVTFCATRRFRRGCPRKMQEHQGFALVTTARDRAVSAPLSFRYVSYLTKSTARERG